MGAGDGALNFCLFIHPESVDEMVDMLKAGPVLSPDVTAFMDDFLAPEYFGRSGARVAQVLTGLAARDHRDHR